MKRASRIVPFVAVGTLAVVAPLFAISVACGAVYGTAEDAVDAAGDAAGDATPLPGQACICVPTAMVGWQGPFARKDGPPEAQPCSAAFPVRAYAGNTGLVNGGPAQCSACTCNAVPTCSIRLTYGNGVCPNVTACNVSPPLTVGDCIDLAPSMQGCAGSSYVNGTGGGLKCTADGGVNVASSPTWKATTTLCGPPDPLPRSDCAAGAVCAPAPPAGFRSSVCVASAGDKPCPEGSPYTQRDVAYSGFIDGRGCSPCSCQQDESVNCFGGTLNVFSDVGCATRVQTFDVSSTCRTLGGNYARYEKTTTGGCAPVPDAGAPTGSVTPQNPTTICCTP